MYSNANKGSLPFGFWSGSSILQYANPHVPYDTSVGNADWTILLTQTMRGQGNQYTDQAAGGTTRMIFVDRDTQPFPEGLYPTEWVHYSAHPRLMPALEESEHAITHAWGQWPFRKPAKLAKVKRPSIVVLIMDGAQIADSLIGNRSSATAFQLDGHNYDNWPTYQPSGGSYLLYNSTNAQNGSSIYAGPNVDAPQMFNNDSGGTIRWRHMQNKSANFLFVDGHAESRRYKNKTTCDLKRENVNTDLFR
ncbi:MAG TPA: hypothetical protein PK402_03050 [Tepidisphaeraceae bacterium]|nr:hypothetical protein [Tepidisphaeraceae bacterium]